VSSFGLWALLLGLSPVLAFHALMASWSQADTCQQLRKKIYTRKHKGRVVTTKTAKNSSSEQQGFCTADVLWAVGIWSVILTLSPVVIFYVLMVNWARG
jgi:hypothetical protein